MGNERRTPKRPYRKPRIERRERLAAVTEELPRGSDGSFTVEE